MNSFTSRTKAGWAFPAKRIIIIIIIIVSIKKVQKFKERLKQQLKLFPAISMNQPSEKSPATERRRRPF